MFRNLKYFSYLISVTHLNDLDAEKKIKKLEKMYRLPTTLKKSKEKAPKASVQR